MQMGADQKNRALLAFMEDGLHTLLVQDGEMAIRIQYQYSDKTPGALSLVAEGHSDVKSGLTTVLELCEAFALDQLAELIVTTVKGGMTSMIFGREIRMTILDFKNFVPFSVRFEDALNKKPSEPAL